MLVNSLKFVCGKISHRMFLIIVHMRSTETIVRKYTTGRLGSQDSNDFRGNKHGMHVLHLMKAVGDIVYRNTDLRVYGPEKCFRSLSKRHSIA